MNPERILVTGGAGFIGSHTVDLLLEAGKQVIVLDNLSSGHLQNLNLQHPNVELVEGDILEYPLIESLVEGCDAVLHLAAIASVPTSIAEPIYTMQVNTQGLLHVLQAIQRANRPIRLVFASSAAVYGNTTRLPCDDALPLTSTPLSPYALQKIHCEQYARFFADHHGINSLALRYFNVYGPRQDPSSPYSGVISRFLAAYQQNETITIFGDGQQSRDFIYVQDVAYANLLALNSDYAGALNIATGTPQTLLQLLDCLQAAGNHPANYQLAPPREGDIKSSYGSTVLAKQYLDFTAQIALAQGMHLLA